MELAGVAVGHFVTNQGFSCHAREAARACAATKRIVLYGAGRAPPHRPFHPPLPSSLASTPPTIPSCHPSCRYGADELSALLHQHHASLRHDHHIASLLELSRPSLGPQARGSLTD